MCFSLFWFEHLLIQLIVLCTVIALVRLLLVPFVLTPMGANGALLIRAVNIVVWCVVAIFVVIVVFDLVRCMMWLPEPMAR
jgi:hypothetical protein